MKLTAGKFDAKIKSYGVNKPEKSKRPGIFVEFEILQPEDDATSKATIIYWGSLDEKTDASWKFHPYEITLKNLATLGLKGLDPYALADNAPGVLNDFRMYQLEITEYTTQDNKTKLQVKYINLPGMGVKNQMNGIEAKKMAGFDFSAAMLIAKQSVPEAKHEVVAAADTNTEDIPF